MDAEYAILLADVVGSTKLYGRVGDKMASKLIFECVERMQRVLYEQHIDRQFKHLCDDIVRRGNECRACLPHPPPRNVFLVGRV